MAGSNSDGGCASVVMSRTSRLGDVMSNFSNNWFEHQIRVPLLSTVTDEQARVAIDQLAQELHAERVGKDATPAFDYHTELEQRIKTGTPSDGRSWRVDLGDQSGSDANDVHVQGVVSEQLPGGIGPTQQSVVVFTGSGDAGRRLHEWVLAHPNSSVGELLDSPQYAMVQQYAARNARQVAALVAGALTNRPLRAIIECEPDRQCAASARVGQAVRAAPQLAVPSHHSVFNTFETRNIAGNGAVQDSSRASTVLYHRDAVNLHSTRAVNNSDSRVLKFLDPSKGFVLRTVKPTEQLVESVLALRTYETQDRNQEFSANKEGAVRKQAWTDHVQRRYVTREGLVPSANSRAFWSVSSVEQPLPTDVRLLPIKLIIHGKQARSSTVASGSGSK